MFTVVTSNIKTRDIIALIVTISLRPIQFYTMDIVMKSDIGIVMILMLMILCIVTPSILLIYTLYFMDRVLKDRFK